MNGHVNPIKSQTEQYTEVHGGVREQGVVNVACVSALALVLGYSLKGQTAGISIISLKTVELHMEGLVQNHWNHVIEKLQIQPPFNDISSRNPADFNGCRIEPSMLVLD